MPLTFSIKVQPGAKADQLIGWKVDAKGRPLLHLKLRAQAIDGKANEALIDFLCEAFHLKPRQISLTHGLHSREKTLVIEGAALESLQNIKF